MLIMCVTTTHCTICWCKSVLHKSQTVSEDKVSQTERAAVSARTTSVHIIHASLRLDHHSKHFYCYADDTQLSVHEAR